MCFAILGVKVEVPCGNDILSGCAGPNLGRGTGYTCISSALL